MTDPVKELRKTSGHRVACLKLSEAVITMVLETDDNGLNFSSAMQGVVRDNLGLDVDSERADRLCLEFVRCCRGRIDNELVFRFAFICYLETREW